MAGISAAGVGADMLGIVRKSAADLPDWLATIHRHGELHATLSKGSSDIVPEVFGARGGSQNEWLREVLKPLPEREFP